MIDSMMITDCCSVFQMVEKKEKQKREKDQFHLKPHRGIQYGAVAGQDLPEQFRNRCFIYKQIVQPVDQCPAKMRDKKSDYPVAE